MDSGFYQLVIRLGDERVIKVGGRGRFSFPAGYYVYTGSGVRGLESRIARHLRKAKKLRWHVDYLLRHGSIVEVRRYGRGHSECALNRKVESLPGSMIVVRGFGSSDCRCSAHLFHFVQNPAAELDRTCPSRNVVSENGAVPRVPRPDKSG